MDGRNRTGAEVGGAEVDGAEVNEAEVDGAEMDGAEVDGAEMKHDRFTFVKAQRKGIETHSASDSVGNKRDTNICKRI